MKYNVGDTFHRSSNPAEKFIIVKSYPDCMKYDIKAISTNYVNSYIHESAINYQLTQINLQDKDNEI